MFNEQRNHADETEFESSIWEHETEDFLLNKKIAIVNPFENRFTDLYVQYFQKNNEVRLIRPQYQKNIFEVLKWSDLIWSQWCNEWLAIFSKESFDGALITHIHSYEILAPQLINNVEWTNVDGIIFVADHIQQNANRLWSEQIKNVPQTMVHNSVDLSEFPFWNGGPGKNIGYIGYLNHKKGISLLMQCIKAAVEHDPEFNLHIAGTFQETRFEVYMLHMIDQMGLKKNVVFHGWVKNIPDWLKSINYVISTSPWEGCPLNLIEAMACGVKPLIHNWQGAKDLFPDKFVFNTIDDFLSLIKDPVYDSEEYREFVARKYNSKINTVKIEKFLAELYTKKISANADKISSLRPQGITKKSSANIADDVLIEDSEPATKKQEINFFQPLARTIELSINRKEFTIDFCRNKHVLHIGCVDAGIMDKRIEENNFLHYQIGYVAKKLIGCDIEDKGLDWLSKKGFEVYKLNLETDIHLLKRLTKQVDVIVIPEVIEHLNNVGKALDNIKACDFKGEILISTPNAFSFRAFKYLGKCVEMVHPDHNYYYSPTTLKGILARHGFRIERLIMYYWPTNDPIGNELERIVRVCPYYAEGMIAIVKDGANEAIS